MIGRIVQFLTMIIVLMLGACTEPGRMRAEVKATGVSYSTVKDETVKNAYIARCAYADNNDYLQEQIKTQTILNGVEAARKDGYEYVAWEGPLAGGLMTTTKYGSMVVGEERTDGYTFIVRGWRSSDGGIPSTARPISEVSAELAAKIGLSKATSASATSPTFQWPASGSVIVSFGKANTAIRIGAAPGIAVTAAEGGIVESATAHSFAIVHALGFRTYYTCADAVSVKQGNRVTSGQAMAVVGAPGTCPGAPGLGFAIYRNKVFIDPLTLLPKR